MRTFRRNKSHLGNRESLRTQKLNPAEAQCRLGDASRLTDAWSTQTPGGGGGLRIEKKAATLISDQTTLNWPCGTCPSALRFGKLSLDVSAPCPFLELPGPQMLTLINLFRLTGVELWPISLVGLCSPSGSDSILLTLNLYLFSSKAHLDLSSKWRFPDHSLCAYLISVPFISTSPSKCVLRTFFFQPVTQTSMPLLTYLKERFSVYFYFVSKHN